MDTWINALTTASKYAIIEFPGSPGQRGYGMSEAIYNTRAWMGKIPERDDFNRKIDNEFIDGRTRQGPWAIMTPVSHKIYGVGLGLGKGQHYRRREDGKFVKVEG